MIFSCTFKCEMQLALSSQAITVDPIRVANAHPGFPAMRWSDEREGFIRLFLTAL